VPDDGSCEPKDVALCWTAYFLLFLLIYENISTNTSTLDTGQIQTLVRGGALRRQLLKM